MTAPATVLPYSRQSIEADDIDAVRAALTADLLTTGPLVPAYERRFAEATGAAHVVACNSGTAALHLAVLALDLGPGAAAIVPSITFLATANVVRMTGAEVMFADVDPDTGLMTAATLQDAIADAQRKGMSVKAALPVHLGGQVCDMESLGAVADRAGIALVEDACHALGLKQVGAARYSRAACFSTHPVKAIATGEGGLVTTSDGVMAARMRLLRSHGMIHDPAAFENRDLAFDDGRANPWYYEMHEIGWNYRLPDLLCALGISQLDKLERFHRRRAEIAAMYDRALAGLAPTVCSVPHDGRPNGWHLYPILVDFERLKLSRRHFMKMLRERGIGTQVHYIPVHTQPYYRRRYGALCLPGADRYYARCISIPIYPAMSDADVSRVVAGLTKIAKSA
jgi:UDP-4-amino-4,6-dideoxy-N-acetyl-beta-L-altrosamine transaminase